MHGASELQSEILENTGLMNINSFLYWFVETNF